MKTKGNLFKHGIILVMIFACLPVFKIYSQETNLQDAVSKIAIKQTDAIKALTIKAEVPTSAIGTKLGEFYTKLYNYTKANQIRPDGPPFTIYLKFDPQGNTDIIVGVPVATESKGEGDILFKVFPAMKVVSTLYMGPYEKMIPVYEAMGKFIKENNLESTGETWEIYLTDPEEVPDSSKYQTLIYFPIKQ
ncbi:MAG: GyrI-like domain-containing protein [Bacteroidota bacterium]|nr:GyrI-like domain-containing protein [Bacteroidota bacterium]MDP4228716.1 GyrI-like domain-containing protein [Bacteroidota bacterium]MDP4274298.1 GyrI-like domain-containing protein [Bacteroidota bacterium]